MIHWQAEVDRQIRLQGIRCLLLWTHVHWMLTDAGGARESAALLVDIWNKGWQYIRRHLQTGWGPSLTATHLEQLHQPTEGLHRGLGQGPLHGHVHVHGGLYDGTDAVSIQDPLERNRRGTPKGLASCSCCCTWNNATWPVYYINLKNKIVFFSIANYLTHDHVIT